MTSAVSMLFYSVASLHAVLLIAALLVAFAPTYGGVDLWRFFSGFGISI
jgi:hypothetical protein